MTVASGITKTFSYGRKSATAATVITRFIPPKRGMRTKIEKIVYTCGSTAHALTVMKPIGVTFFAPGKLAAHNTAGQPIVVLATDPGNYAIANPVKQGIGTAPGTVLPLPTPPSTANQVIATTNLVVYEKPDGSYVFDTVNGVPVINSDGTVTVTLTANLPTGGVNAPAASAVGLGVANGYQGYGRLWLYGSITANEPDTGEAHAIFTMVASVVTTLEVLGGGSVIESAGLYEPLVIQSNNATTAGTIEHVSGIYTS